MSGQSLHMPPRAPLEMPEQNLRQAPDAPRDTAGKSIWRSAVFLPALAITAGLLWSLYGLLKESGMSNLEYLLLTLIGMTFVWITLAVSTAAIGLMRRRAPDTPANPSEALDVALLVPIYNENTSDVFGNAKAMLDDLPEGEHTFSLFILSDTRDEAIASQEEQAFESLRATAGIKVHYRRRVENTDRKTGNLVEWITNYGAAYDAMLILDADSLMSGRAIARLTDELAADPKAGLIQSFPMLLAGNSLFARLQQFSHTAYGWLLAEGLAAWSQTEGNYWGHNAIVRTRAFAATAGLPHLKGLRGQRDLIMSHDFVEASLLRRAGWRVRFLPRIAGSFEEAPGTLIDYVVRDARWCRGNLQHLRLLGTAGLHPVSRFHLFQGAAAYLMSPAWFVLLVFWALLGRGAETNIVTYFSEASPLFPSWPPEMTHIDSAMFLLVMYGMLLATKIAGAAVIAAYPKASRVYGGRLAFLTAFVVEVAMSIAYAPIMMIQQTKAVVRAALTRSNGWAPQQRDARAYPLRTLIAFHWSETLLGLLLLAGVSSGLVSLWLFPIMASLVLAIPLSALSAWQLGRRLPKGLRLESPLSLREPAIQRKARAARTEFENDLAEPNIAAE